MRPSTWEGSRMNLVVGEWLYRLSMPENFISGSILAGASFTQSCRKCLSVSFSYLHSLQICDFLFPETYDDSRAYRCTRSFTFLIAMVVVYGLVPHCVHTGCGFPMLQAFMLMYSSVGSLAASLCSCSHQVSSTARFTCCFHWG